MRETWVVVIFGLLIALSQQVLAAPASPDAVVVFLSVQGQQAEIPTLEFYRAVSDEITLAKSWSMVGGAEVSKATSITGMKFLGRIPVLSRDQLLKSHPEVSRYDRRTGGSGGSQSTHRKIIPQVQETLDTLAVQGGVIVDCQQADGSGSGGTKLRGCGLYYYDRVAGRIVASTRKSFRVGVATANMWAPSMVDGLKAGLEAHRAKQDRDRLSSIEEKSDHKELPARPYIALGLIGESLRIKGGDNANLAGAVAGVGAAYSGRSLGIEYTQSSFRGDRSLDRDFYESRSAGLVFGVTAEAMDIVTWGLDITAGVAERRYVSEDEEILRARQPLIGVRPGIFWKVRRGWLMGATVSYRAAYGGEEKIAASVGQRGASGFHSGSWSTGIGTRVEF